jgi:hypothetical protein
MSHVIAPRFIGPALGDGGYQVDYSCRFNSGDSTYLSRTPGGAGNRRTWTFSTWVKRAGLGTTQALLHGGTGTHPNRTLSTVRFDSSGFLEYYDFNENGASYSTHRSTNALYRDPSAWMHIVVRYDTTQVTPNDRVRLYVNGTQVTSFSASVDPSQDYDGQILNANTLYIGREEYNAPFYGYPDLYLGQTVLLDGQSLDASSFGEFDSNGVWRPIDVSSLTFGINGFLLDFAHNTTVNDLGLDAVGSNNFTAGGGLAITDRMIDTPTTNYAVLNALAIGGPLTLSDGNLKVTQSNDGYCATTIGAAGGKWYWEVHVDTLSGLGAGFRVGIVDSNAIPTGSTASPESQGFTSYVYCANGNKDHATNPVSYGATYTNGDVIAVALDLDTKTIEFFKNNVSQGVAYTGIASSIWYPMCYIYSVATFNFGQRPFTYTPPFGFKALNTANLPEPTIKDGTDNYETVLDTGANIKTAAEAAFPSFLEWIKDRQNSNNHQLIDSVRGTSAVLQSNTTAIETTYSTPSGDSVAWVWKADGSGVTNTAGSITSTVSANAAAGFSVVTYTGTGSNATVGHGLGKTPNLIIVKERDVVQNWRVYHAALGAGNYLSLDLTNASFSSSTMWNNTAPTSTVFGIGTDTSTNEGGKLFVAYCFAEIPGYSKIGSYIGNGSADGPFVWCGFTPAWIMIKGTSSDRYWPIRNSTPDAFNPNDAYIYANAVDGEASASTMSVDFVSNGFKMRTTGTQINGGSETYIYIAFAENPFGGKDTTPMTAR